MLCFAIKIQQGVILTLLFATCSFSLLAQAPDPAIKTLAKRDVLSLAGGKFFLDGERFAEISFNKFDLFWALYSELDAGRELNDENPMVQAQENALANLKKLGFRSIRVFAFPPGENAAQYVTDSSRLQVVFQAMDKMVELCNKHQIGVLWSLGCHQFVDENEHLRELFGNPQSKNRQILNAYLDQVVGRYRTSPAVLMWEIGNELTLAADIGDAEMVFNGKRMPTLKNVADFYDDIAKLIKARDPLRLVSNGGSIPRTSQWNLYKRKGWMPDTYAEQGKCFRLLFANSAVDVIDIHYYLDIKPGLAIATAGGRERIIGLADYLAMARQVDKPLIVGEIAPSTIPESDEKFWKENPNYFKSYFEPKTALPWVNRILDEVVNSGVPLTYWWAYQSDRPVDQSNIISVEKTPEIVEAIANANKRLKAKLGVKEAPFDPPIGRLRNE